MNLTTSDSPGSGGKGLFRIKRGLLVQFMLEFWYHGEVGLFHNWDFVSGCRDI